MDNQVFSHFVEIDGQVICKSCESSDVYSIVRTDSDSLGFYDVAVAQCKSCHFGETVELDQ